MSNGLMYSASGLSPFVFTSTPRSVHADDMLPASRQSLVSDFGDDYEINENAATALARAGDRLTGFMTGAAVLGAIWFIWSLI